MFHAKHCDIFSPKRVPYDSPISSEGNLSTFGKQSELVAFRSHQKPRDSDRSRRQLLNYRFHEGPSASDRYEQGRDIDRFRSKQTTIRHSRFHSVQVKATELSDCLSQPVSTNADTASEQDELLSCPLYLHQLRLKEERARQKQKFKVEVVTENVDSQINCEEVMETAQKERRLSKQAIEIAQAIVGLYEKTENDLNETISKKIAEFDDHQERRLKLRKQEARHLGYQREGSAELDQIRNLTKAKYDVERKQLLKPLSPQKKVFFAGSTATRRSYNQASNLTVQKNSSTMRSASTPVTNNK